MMFSILIASGYVAILLVFGWAVAVYVLHIRQVPAIVGMTLGFGTATYMVVTNALGYIIAIRPAFTVALVLMLATAVLILINAHLKGRLFIPRSAFIPAPRWLMFSLSIVAVLCGIMGARFLGSDPNAWIHFPLASTIVSGNFPVVEVVNPWDKLGYHYGQALLAAAFTALTNFPLSFGYGIQPFLGIAGVLFFGAALAFELTRSWRAAFIGAVLAVFGGGLMWVNIFRVFQDVFLYLTSRSAISAPFKYLVPSFGSSIVLPIINSIGWRTFATGTPIFFALCYCLYKVFSGTESRRHLRWGAVCIIFLAALALTMEGSFLLFYPALLTFFAVVWFQKFRAGESLLERWPQPMLLVTGVFLVALAIASYQGGTLSARGADVNESAFSIWFNGQTGYHTAGYLVGFWQWPFLRDFGLPLLFLPFISIYFWRRRTESAFPVFLLILALGHLTAPFVVHYKTLPGEMKRLFTPAISLFAFLTGIFLEQTLLRSDKIFKRVLGYGFMGMMIFAGVLYSSTRLLFPTFRFEAAPLFAKMPEVSQEERDLYAWVREHSTIKDYFYLYTNDDTRADALFTTKTEQQVQQLDRIHFMTYTGRYTIGIIQSYHAMSDARWTLIHRFERTCKADVAAKLQIRFLVALTADRARWFRDRCVPEAWDVVYGPVPGKEYPRVYELRKT
ncbi:MAG: hypothetical protein WC840_05715 [Candidatus Peribacteraceae bacterium]